ncbi:hypothetical protein V6N13_014756 [Hibiscus sabdariffa]|uniref:AT-hook motif nuclear-localized protein n=1 Tax=Hibiscus sabdariffa TaxID=183260 RepID=A0ABR2RWB0_9ROSI
MERKGVPQYYYTENPSATVNTTPSPSPSPSPSSTPTPTPSPSLSKPPLPCNVSAGGSHYMVYPPPLPSAETSTSQIARRKRGRPRKYGTPEQAMAANPKSQQLSLGAVASLSRSSKESQSDGLGNAVQGFILHVINVAAGEDVSQKVTTFMEQSKRESCILSASGTISKASLRQLETSGSNNIAHEGRFDIISLSGSYVRTETGEWSGGLSVCLSRADGQIIGGGVGGPLKAAGPVQVIVATFMIDRKKDVSANVVGDASGSKLPPSAAGTSVSDVGFRSAFEALGRNPIDALGSKLPSSAAGTLVSDVGFHSAFEAPGRSPIDASGSKLPSSVAGTSASNVGFRFEAPGRSPIDASGSKLPSSFAGTSASNLGFRFEAPGRSPIDASGSKLPSSVVGTSASNLGFRFEAPGRNPIDAWGSKLPSSAAGTSVSDVGIRSAFEAPGRNLIDAWGSKLPSSVAGTSASNVGFHPAFEAPGRNPIGASGSKLPSSVSVTSVSNVGFRPAFEVPGSNPIGTHTNDDHQRFGGSHFMTQPQGQHLASRPTDWTTGLDDRTTFELTGKTGHGAHHQSLRKPEP